jgi:hypothetical protein
MTDCDQPYVHKYSAKKLSGSLNQSNIQGGSPPIRRAKIAKTISIKGSNTANRHPPTQQHPPPVVKKFVGWSCGIVILTFSQPGNFAHNYSAKKLSKSCHEQLMDRLPMHVHVVKQLNNMKKVTISNAANTARHETAQKYHFIPSRTV